jgi:hypothetical protein
LPSETAEVSGFESDGKSSIGPDLPFTRAGQRYFFLLADFLADFAADFDADFAEDFFLTATDFHLRSGLSSQLSSKYSAKRLSMPRIFCRRTQLIFGLPSECSAKFFSTRQIFRSSFDV